MNILEPWPKTEQGNHFVVVMTDRCTKPINSVLTPKANATTVARIFSEHWVANLGIPSELLTDNGPRFVSNVLVLVCSTFGVNNTITTEYDPQVSS